MSRSLAAVEPLSGPQSTGPEQWQLAGRLPLPGGGRATANRSSIGVPLEKPAGAGHPCSADLQPGPHASGSDNPYRAISSPYWSRTNLSDPANGAMSWFAVDTPR